MTNADLLITFNAGSSSIKIGLFEMGSSAPGRIASGVIDFRHQPLRFHVTQGLVVTDVNLQAEATDDLRAVMAETFGWLAKHVDVNRIAAAGHRVVHGGDAFAAAIRINDGSLAKIEALTELAPLHQPQSLRVIHAIGHLRPSLAQTASFDTAFHRSNADVVRRFAIPRDLHDAGIKRYGFHGLSYKFIAGELARRFPALATRKVVVSHLGSGASVCALDGGISRDTSMGFSALDGIPMATRCGALDPGVLLHLLGPVGRTRDDIENLLYRESGLLGMSGISADSRDLLASDRPEAREAIDVFTFRIAGEVARLATSLGGIDAVIFTAGIGEHQPQIRAKVAERLRWLGLELDAATNTTNAETISTATSRVAALVIPTNEEQVIADEAFAILHEKALQ